MAITEVGSGSQRASGHSTTKSVAVAYPGSVTSGNLLVCAGGWYCDSASVSVSSVATTRSANLTVYQSSWTSGSDNWVIWIAIGPATSDGACTVTATVAYSSGGGGGAAAIDEFTGQDSTPLRTDGGRYQTASTSSPSDTITGSDDDLTLGVVMPQTATSSTPYTVGTGYTKIGEETNNFTYSGMNFEFKMASGGSPYTVNWTESFGACVHDIYDITVEPAAGGATPLQYSFGDSGAILSETVSPLRPMIGQISDDMNT
jgi:hypothetical protein